MLALMHGTQGFSLGGGSLKGADSYSLIYGPEGISGENDGRVVSMGSTSSKSTSSKTQSLSVDPYTLPT
jgi:hypothetical protein